MNHSFDETTSRSTADHLSESSPVKITSPPRPTSLLNISLSNTNDHSTTQSNGNNQPQPSPSLSSSHQQTPHFPVPDSFLFHNPMSAPFHAHHHHHQADLRAIASHQWPLQYSTPTRRTYTGVDKLLMAAMMEESAVAVAAAAAASASTTSYMPSGRGIGYYQGACEPTTQIPSPSNKSELELYRLLERANLLTYFRTFLNFGGDDVQQLSDADEDEFLEIMRLVGMTQKPLHVRRLQKALIDWRDNREISS